MIEVLTKSADRITSAEIESLITYRVPESERVEYKQRLPAKTGKVDPWEDGKDQIGDHARNDILREVTAFANAYGGVLVLGMEESATTPPVAQSISPVPRAAELAERMKMIFRDCVEPQLPRIEVVAVPTSDDGSGAVVFRVGKSRLSPHRVTTTLICPIRRQDRCEKMTMREIQDMTLNLARGMERLDQRLSGRATRFKLEFDQLETPDNALGVRMTAAPVVDEIRIDRVVRNGRILQELDTPWCNVVYGVEGRKRQLKGWQDGFQTTQSWRPMLRAARAEYRSALFHKKIDNNDYRELHDDGLVEFGLVKCLRRHNNNHEFHSCPLDPDYPITLFANLVNWADYVRMHANSPTVEYVIEVEFHHSGLFLQVGRYRGTFFDEDLPVLPRGTNKFPRYSFGNSEEIPDLVKLFCRDVWNFVGQDKGDENASFELIRS